MMEPPRHSRPDGASAPLPPARHSRPPATARAAAASFSPPVRARTQAMLPWDVLFLGARAVGELAGGDCSRNPRFVHEVLAHK